MVGVAQLLPAQQVVDTAFTYRVERPAYTVGTGPVVLIDAAHVNFHTAEGRYRPFAELARADGYTVRSLTSAISAASLAGARVFVTANARAASTSAEPELPAIAAFTSDEVIATRQWVEAGGSLLIIADHMPIAGTMETLAAAFGIYLIDSFVYANPTDTLGTQSLVFRRSDGTLASHPITNGRSARERIDSVATFTGAVFRNDVAADTVLALPAGSVAYLPMKAWAFTEQTPRFRASHMLQAATRSLGAGRVAVFAEAGMFTAQRAGAARLPMGMNAPEASQNPQFALNLLHWLSGMLPLH